MLPAATPSNVRHIRPRHIQPPCPNIRPFKDMPDAKASSPTIHQPRKYPPMYEDGGKGYSPKTANQPCQCVNSTQQCEIEYRVRKEHRQPNSFWHEAPRIPRTSDCAEDHAASSKMGNNTCDPRREMYKEHRWLVSKLSRGNGYGDVKRCRCAVYACEK